MKSKEIEIHGFGFWIFGKRISFNWMKLGRIVVIELYLIGYYKVFRL